MALLLYSLGEEGKMMDALKRILEGKGASWETCKAEERGGKKGMQDMIHLSFFLFL